MRRTTKAYAILIGLLIIILIPSASPVTAADLLKGNVSDETGRPLRGASVATIRSQDIVTTVKTGDDGGFEIHVDAGVTKILIYCDNVSTPGWDYLPALIDLGGVAGNLIVSLSPGASVELSGDIQFVYSEKLPLRTRYDVRGEDGKPLVPSGFPLVFSYKGEGLIQVPGIGPYTLIVPTETPTEVYVNCSIIIGSSVVNKSLKIKPLRGIAKGDSLKIDVRAYSLPQNIEIVEGLLDSVKARLTAMGGLGFYLSKEISETSGAELKLLDARSLYDSGDYPECFDAGKVSYISLRHTMDTLDGLYRDASISVYILVAFLATMSIAIGFLLSDSSARQVIAGSATYIVSLLILYATYPGSNIIPRDSFGASAVLSFVGLLVLAALLPRLMGRGVREGRVRTWGILAPIFNIAKRSLVRRRFRFLLTLISLTALVMSFVTLTSFSEGYGLISRKVSSQAVPIDGVLIRSSSWNEDEPSPMVGGELDTAWLGRQPEVQITSVKAESIPMTISVISLNRAPLRGVLGFDPTVEEELVDIRGGLVEGSLPGPGGVAVSSGMKEKLGAKVGNRLKLGGEYVILQGVIDDDFLSGVIDIDGSTYLPGKLVNIAPEGSPADYELKPCDPNEVVLAHIDVAMRTPSVVISRIDLKVGAGFSPYDFAERLALERGYQAWSSSSSGIEYVALSSYLEGKGLPLVVPWVIVVLNVVVTMLNSLFERRKEIGILSSVGLNPAQISMIFIAEASLTGFIAGGLGYLLGLGTYRVMSLVGLSLEVQQKVSAFWSFAAIGIAISAVLVGAALALKSSVVITPSLTRRWSGEEAADNSQSWITTIPVKLKQEHVEDFADFLMTSLRRLENDPAKMTSSLKIVRGEGRIQITFIHRATQMIAGSFWTKSKITIGPGPNGECSVTMASLGNLGMTHETGSMIRMLAMEWSTGIGQK